MPKQPIRRARIAWQLAGCFMAVARRDWKAAVGCAIEALRLLGEVARAEGRFAEVEPMLRRAGFPPPFPKDFPDA